MASFAMKSALVAPARPQVRSQAPARPMSVRVKSAPSPGSVEKAIKEAEEACATGKAAVSSFGRTSFSQFCVVAVWWSRIHPGGDFPSSYE